MQKIIFSFLALVFMVVSASAQTGDAHGQKDASKQQGVMMSGGMMEMCMPMMGQMMGQGMMMRDMMQMMTDSLKVQRKLIKGVNSAEKNEMMKDMDKMIDKMDKMMTDMRGMMNQGMMGITSQGAKKEDKPKEYQEKNGTGGKDPHKH